MQEKQQKNCILSVTVAALAVASVLLANPLWGLVDILPDLFAWVAVWFALRFFAQQNENMVSARRMSLYLMALSAGKLLLLKPVLQSDIPTNSMLATLVFCFSESACMLLFFRSFLHGAEELARAGDCERMYAKTENVHFLCSLFVITRAVCNLLPELTAIPDWSIRYGEITDEQSYSFLAELAGSKELLTVICSVPVIIVAVVWLVSFLPFLRLFDKDSSMRAYFEAYLQSDSPERRSKRRLSALHMARLCFAVGLFFVLDLQIDTIRILPICVFPLLFACGCLFLQRFSRGVADERGFRCPILLALLSAAVLLGGELYRHFCTVWDLKVYTEVEIGKEVCLSVWAIVGMGLLLCFWLFFSVQVERMSAAFGCGELRLERMPYLLLVLLALAWTAVFVLPLTAGSFNFARIALCAVLWLTVNRRLAAFEDRVQGLLSLGTVG